ncbi:MAG: hypothetical protein A7315_12665 [Candidatus Altiarchaeales archaeon WOR_SM1_79]|nr:MAG: hypothetical protein A7315_12665 [Candidatus Altiarchaeales archaeon WOR_SM1_79]
MLENKIKIHAAKDASRGGWFGNLAEMLIKAKCGCTLTGIPYPKISRYMGRDYYKGIGNKIRE